MKKLFSFIIIILPLISFAHSGDTVYVEQGTSPVIDGVISAGEWDDATVITYQAGFSGHEMSVTCYLKHNNDTLYIAQNIPDMHNGDRNLITFDIEHNAGSNPQTDDFSCNRYHAADASSWEGTGTGSTWSSYSTPTDWFCNLTGAPCGWEGDLGETEFAIAFSKLGITSGTYKILGFNIYFGELLGDYDPNVLWNWATDGDYFIPDSWGDIVFFDTQTNIREQDKNHSVSIYPNPTSGSFTISGEDIQSIEITNISGQIIKQFTTINRQISIDLSEQTKGIYFVKMKTADFIKVEKIIIQ